MRQNDSPPDAASGATKADLQSHNASGIRRVLRVQELQQLDLCFCLLQKGLFRLDYLDSDRLSTLAVICFDDLTKRTLANHVSHLVPLIEQFTALNDVIVVLVVVT